ncbi:MAG TPA: hypothetical protein VK168_17990 [Saprospiraceae bacterium]|nr:hypothetical protein [Saprospiraceae bacterium]
MGHSFPSVLLLGLLSLFLPGKSHACGFNWVGDCSSSIHLRINGTPDSFNIAACPSGLNYNGLYLGQLQSLSLANAKAVTWESCQNNVTEVSLKYRLYEEGGGAGGFLDYVLAEDFAKLDGPYTTRYRSNPGNLDLTTGLVIGKTYVLEVYMVAQVDTIGDDFVPETQLLKDNNGQFYRITFTFGGQNAPPFAAIPTIAQAPKCHGNTNGAIHISVWGDQTNLSYQWSNSPANFYEQLNLPGGTYTVTVTGANHQEVLTLDLPEPEAITITPENVLAVGCNNVLGEATLEVTGGVGNYTYNWSHGQTTQQAFFAVSGTFSVTVQDANGCTAQKTIPIEKADPGFLLIFLPDGAYLTCQYPISIQCVADVPGASYKWFHNNVPTSTTHCDTISTGGLHKLTINWQGCVASRNMSFIDQKTTPTGKIIGNVTMPCQYDSIEMLLTAQTNVFNPSFSWVYQGQELSNTNTCLFVITEFETGPNGMLTPVLPELFITDVPGCTGLATSAVTISEPAQPILMGTVTNAGGQGASNGAIQVQIIGGTFPVAAIWSNGATTLSLTNLPAGEYCVTITDALGCTDTECFVLVATSATEEPDPSAISVYPNPVASGATVQISFLEGLASELRLVRIWSPYGRLLQEINPAEWIKNGKMELALSSASGLYTLEIMLKKTVVFKKIAVFSDN